MKDLFNLNNCYQDEEYYYFFRALNMRDLSGIKDKSILDSEGNIAKIITDREFFKREERYNANSSLTLEEMVNHVKMHYDKDTNCISLSSDANVCLMYGRGDYEDKYIIVKVPKQELGVTTFNAGKYIYEEIAKRVEDYIAKHDRELDELQKYYVNAIRNAVNKSQLDNIKETLPQEYTDITSNRFQNGLTFIDSKSYEGYTAEENLAKDKLVMLLDVLDFEVVKGKTNRLVIRTMGSAFSSRELEYYQTIPQEKIISISSSLAEVMGLLQQVVETKEIRGIKNYLIANLDEVKNKVLNADYSKFDGQNLDMSLDNIYNLTGGKISYKEARELYLNAMYVARSKVRVFNAVQTLQTILGDKYSDTLQEILNNGFGIEPSIMSRKNIKYDIKVSDTISLTIPKDYQSVVDYINGLSINDMSNLFNNSKEAFNTLFSNYVGTQDIEPQNKEKWYANGIIDMVDLSSMGIEASLNLEQRKKIINDLVSRNFMDFYDKVKDLPNFEQIATAMLASLVSDNEEFKNNAKMILEQLKGYIGYNKLKDYNLSLRSVQREAVTNIDKLYQGKSFAAAVMPTGLGKSFVALYEMLQQRDKKILYLAPNDIILGQIKHYVKMLYGYNDYHTLFNNLILATYQDLKNSNNKDLKEKYNTEYDFIILDELHRSGAPEWYEYVKKLMDRQDKKEVKILGITATPERDRDEQDMGEIWAKYFGYSDKDLILGRHLAMSKTLADAIVEGILPNPKFINCLYSFESSGALQELNEDLAMLGDDDKKNDLTKKYELCRRSIVNSTGIEKILGDNLEKNGKYVVFLPVNRRDDGTYETVDGESVSKTTAERLIKDYMALVRQYLYSNAYMQVNGDTISLIYNKIVGNETLSKEELVFLNKEKEDILLLDTIDIQNKPKALDTLNSIMVRTITKYLGWERLEKEELSKKIKEQTKDMLDTNSLLGSYSKARNDKELSSFNEKSSGKPKLLFVLNKLNEGAHLSGVKGIIWLRPLSKNSRILFYQELGRCIASREDGYIYKESDSPIVIDLVNNLYTVDLNKNNEYLKNDLEYLQRIVSWVEENGKYPEENSLLKEERYFSIKLSIILNKYINYFQDDSLLEKVKIKDKIIIQEILRTGSIIDLWNMPIKEDERLNNLEHLQKKEKEYLDGIFKMGSVMSSFVDLKNELEEELDSVTTFDKWFKIAENYYKENGDLLVPDGYVTPNGEKLGSWIANKRAAYNHTGRERISYEQIVKLESIGMIWNDILDYKWNQMYELAADYYKEHNNLLIPINYVTVSGKKLGSWINEQRKAYANNSNKTMSLTRIAKLEAIGMAWKPYDYYWDKMYEYAKLYYETHGNLLVPQSYKTLSGNTLGTWISNQRQAYKNNNLTLEQKEKLDQIGMVWKTKDNQWDSWYALAQDYYEKNGNLQVPNSYVTSSGEKLGQWIGSQRKAYNGKSTNKITLEQIKRLENIGMVWDIHNTQWDKMYEYAKSYYETHGNLLVPQLYKTSSGETLGVWVANQRKAYANRNKATISNEQIFKLEDIGMVWDVSDYQWNRMYELARIYYNEHCDLKIPSLYVTPSGEKLGQWIGCQRKAYNGKSTNKISKEQIEKLESLGMVWDVKANKEDIANYLDNECPVKIDKKINKDVLDRVSLIELKSKINFLLDRGEEIVDSKGVLLDIFKMSSVDILNKYGISLEYIIKTYGRNEARK